jgi:hypothetical protein
MSSSSSTIISNGNRKTSTEATNNDEPYARAFTFFKSPEGVAEYEKLGMKYPKTMPDDWY